jgi:hypothetical protein
MVISIDYALWAVLALLLVGQAFFSLAVWVSSNLRALWWLIASIAYACAIIYVPMEFVAGIGSFGPPSSAASFITVCIILAIFVENWITCPIPRKPPGYIS